MNITSRMAIEQLKKDIRLLKAIKEDNLYHSGQSVKIHIWDTYKIPIYEWIINKLEVDDRV